MHRMSRGLLLIEDEPAQAGLISALAARAGWRVVRSSAGSPIGHQGQVDAILMDVWSSHGDAVGTISSLHARFPNTPIVVITAQDRADLAVEAMRAGASDFIVRPIAPDRLLAALDHTSARKSGELQPLAEKTSEPLTFEEMIGRAPGFRLAVDTAARVAATPAPILIEGESGVGKEVFAQAIHRGGPLRDGPLVAVNCGAIPANLVESELFGHERGAFTGAFDRRAGHFASADGGTIFLDEIGELPADAQVKLLRVLQSGEIQPVGARASRRVSVRVIAATNRSLAADVAAGRFREDLFYRLAVVSIAVPPLRERIEDLAPLASHLLARIGTQLGSPGLAIDSGAIRLLESFPWPGNVRQLHNVLFRAAIFCANGCLTAGDFPHLARSTAPTASAAPLSNGHQIKVPISTAAMAGAIPLYCDDGHVRALDDIESDMIRLAISHYQGRMTEVARRLGIGRSTLYRKLGELGIDQLN
jgi:DNA-binding NtrC family response regulator